MVSLDYEKRLALKGFKLVAGVDEVGRGSLAGPIVAAAVILPLNCHLPGLDDSKKLSPSKRERLYLQIKKHALGVGVGMVSCELIDHLGIGEANLLAMKKAVENLKVVPDFLLVDGPRHKVNLTIPQKGIAQGDAKCTSIAAASVIAKVTRDRLMIRYHQKYPNYGFARNKGYGTSAHMEMLLRFGPCPIHRRSFRPIRSDLTFMRHIC